MFQMFFFCACKEPNYITENMTFFNSVTLEKFQPLFVELCFEKISIFFFLIIFFNLKNCQKFSEIKTLTLLTWKHLLNLLCKRAFKGKLMHI